MMWRWMLITVWLFSGHTFAYSLEQLAKVGQARLEILFWDIYDSELYTPSGSFTEQSYPVALRIRYLRPIESTALVERTAMEWQRLGLAESVQQPWLSRLGQIWPDIRTGDELLVWVEPQHSTFYFNGNAVGVVDDPRFGRNFLAIWLSEQASFPALRAQLLGQRP